MLLLAASCSRCQAAAPRIARSVGVFIRGVPSTCVSTGGAGSQPPVYMPKVMPCAWVSSHKRQSSSLLRGQQQHSSSMTHAQHALHRHNLDPANPRHSAHASVVKGHCDGTKAVKPSCISHYMQAGARLRQLLPTQQQQIEQEAQTAPHLAEIGFRVWRGHRTSSTSRERSITAESALLPCASGAGERQVCGCGSGSTCSSDGLQASCGAPIVELKCTADAQSPHQAAHVMACLWYHAHIPSSQHTSHSRRST